MAEKIIFTMGEVAEMFDVKPSLLRHWESQFPILRPKRNKKGNRLFTQQDIENLKLIYHLVKERGMTLDGAKKAMRGKKTTPELSRNAELAERLQRIRSMLLEVREELKMEDDEVIDDEEIAAAEPEVVVVAAEPEVVAAEPECISESESKSKSEPMPELEPEPAPHAALFDAEPSVSDTQSEEAEVEDVAETAVDGLPKPRRRRRKKDGEEKELFAFYEQSLF